MKDGKLLQLDIEGVGKEYPNKTLGLVDFSLQLTPGVLGLLGPNGAGKSTLMNILATVTKPTWGRVRWNGRDIVRYPDVVRRIIGYLPQDFGVYPHLNAWEFLEYMAVLRGLERKVVRQRIATLLELTNLIDAARRPLGGYSAGMRQRIGIAQALLNDPQLLIVDEPTAGLDPEERIRFRNLLTELAGERIVILSTHIVSDVEAVADRIVLLYKGHQLADLLPEHMLSTVKGQVWEQVVSSAQLNEWRARYIVSGATRRADGVHLRLVSKEPPTPSAIPLEPTLEDAYLLFLTHAGPDPKCAGDDL